MSPRKPYTRTRPPVITDPAAKARAAIADLREFLLAHATTHPHLEDAHFLLEIVAKNVEATFPTPSARTKAPRPTGT